MDNPDQTEARMRKALNEVEKHITNAHESLKEATGACGVIIPVPYHLEKAKLETKHAIKRFKIRRTRLED